MGKSHGAEVPRVHRDHFFHTISFRDREQQSVDVRESQLTVALQDCRRSLMVGLVCLEQLDAALASPARHDPGGFGRARRRVARLLIAST